MGKMTSIWAAGSLGAAVIAIIAVFAGGFGGGSDGEEIAKPTPVTTRDTAETTPDPAPPVAPAQAPAPQPEPDPEPESAEVAEAVPQPAPDPEPAPVEAAQGDAPQNTADDPVQPVADAADQADDPAPQPDIAVAEDQQGAASDPAQTDPSQPTPEPQDTAPTDTQPDLDVAAAPIEDPTTPDAAPLPEAPVFDLVRAESDGSTLVAGNGTAGALLEVLVDDTPEAETILGNDGKFVSFLDLEGRYGARVLRLRLTQGDHVVLSQEDVIVVVPEPKADPKPAPGPEPKQVAQADTQPQVEPGQPAPAPSTPQDAGAQTGVETGAETQTEQDLPQIPSEPEIPAVAEQEPQTQTPAPAPTVLKSGPEGVSVMSQAPATIGEVTLDAVTYGDAGSATFTGRGDAGASVQLYLDNALVVSDTVADTGRWQATLETLAPGRYLARVDQLDAAGEVTARIEQVFVREAETVLNPVAQAPDTQAPGTGTATSTQTRTQAGATPAAAASAKLVPVRSVTIESGNTLWAISRERYGDGNAYVKIFEANKDLIRNPDLIYPGQVFIFPEE